MRFSARPWAIVVGVCLAGRAPAAVRYVDVNSTTPTPPYTNWSTAAAVIQDAVDAAVAGDEVVVTNGVYQTGGRAVGTSLLVNRVAVDRPLSLRSVNGPQFTVIEGYQVPVTTNGDGAIRCVYLTNGASLAGFTLTNGATRMTGNWLEDSGGGLLCEPTNTVASNCVLVANSAAGLAGGAYRGTLFNCVLSGNVASAGGGASGWLGWYSVLNNCVLSNNVAGSGGGAFGNILNDCVLNGNSARSEGGGAWHCTLNRCALTNNSAIGSRLYGFGGGGADSSTMSDCVLTGNRANGGGGTHDCTLTNCTVTGNSATNFGGGTFGGTLWNCIVYHNTAPNSPNYSVSGLNESVNNSCTTPLPTNGVGNIASAPLFVDQAGGNFRLQFNSPGINAGNNAFAPGATDLDGNPRIVGGTVDVGAYEFQPSLPPWYAWALHHGLPVDGSENSDDPDGDGMNNLQEWRANTDPTSALSALRMLSPTSNDSGITVRWESSTSRNYWLERAGNLAAQPAFSIIASNLPGQIGSTAFTDTNAIGAGTFFYRVGVQP